MESFIIANGIPVHVSKEGKGEKVIFFLHGFLETMYVWEGFKDLFTKHFTILSIDLPGHGLSGTHPVSNTLLFMSDVLADVLKYYSIEKTTIIGHSMGGYLGVEFAKIYPDKVDSIIMLNSTPFADSSEKREERYREIELIKAGKLSAIASISLPKMFSQSNVVKFQNTIDELIELCEIHENDGIISSITGLTQREDNFVFLKRYPGSVLFIFGLYDRFISEERAMFILTEMKDKKGVILSESGHISFVEERDKTAELINDFLN